MVPKIYKTVLGGLLLSLGIQSGLAQTASYTTKDKLHGYVGELRGATAFTPSSPTGKAGDFAIDFSAAGGGSILITNVAFLNTAAANDTMSFSLWVKKYDIASSSAFYAYSPSVNGNFRGWQAHIPWSNNNLYFDTAGCCDGATQRINGPITDFAGYASVGDDSWWQSWHHFVFSKKAEVKQIWVDGQLFMEGSSTSPLPTDFTQLVLGGGYGGGSLGDYMHGLIDDLAVYSTALTEANIGLLAAGTTPTAIKNETLLAFWDFNDCPVIGATVGSPVGFNITVNNVGSSVADTNTIQLTLGGASVAPTALTLTPSSTVIAYTLANPPFTSGSTQYVTLNIKDKGGSAYSSSSSFVVPIFGTLKQDAALPATSVDTSKPGFKIRTYQLDDTLVQANSLALTEEILAGNKGPNVADLTAAGGVDGKGYFTWTGVVNFDVDVAAVNGRFVDPDYPANYFPGIPGSPATTIATENFALEYYTALQLPNAGLYTMVVNSDDGFRVGTGSNPADILAGNILGQFDAGRGASDTAFQFYVEKAGIYSFRTIYEQGGGGGNMEWFMVNDDGTRVLINDSTNSIKAFQWMPATIPAYVIRVSPGKDALSAAPNFVQATLMDGSTPIDKSTVSLKIDGATVAATVVKTNNTITVSYIPSPLFAAQSSHTATLAFTEAGATATRDWKFTVGSYTKDKVHSYVGAFSGAAAISADMGGASGKAGDRALELTTAGGAVYADGAFLNNASVNDEMSFAFWIKSYDVVGNSAFWGYSPSSASSGRGWQAHVPWSDNNIYFDTAGCCDAGTQRINGSITTFPAYTGSTAYWKSWRHLVFTKKADVKQVYIDGQLFLEGSNMSPLPTDFTQLWIGAQTANTSMVHGMIDDFAVFSTALTEASALKLAQGTAPTALTAEKLLAYWDFNDAPVVTTAPSLKAEKTTAGLVITFEGTLQSADSVTGTWTDLAGSSPMTVPTSGGAKYFRAKR